MRKKNGVDRFPDLLLVSLSGFRFIPSNQLNESADRFIFDLIFYCLNLGPWTRLSQGV